MVESRSRADEAVALIRSVVRTVDEAAGLDRLWTGGLVHAGGPHYRLRGTLVPISIGEDECLALARIIERFRPRRCFIVGNAFGVSSVVIAKVMERCGGEAVITLDSKSEGHGERCHRVAELLRQRLNAVLLTNKVGWSPRDVGAAAGEEAYDLVFIDGDHSHPQVTHDFEGVQGLVHERTIVCWHDFWVDGVPQSVAAAEAAGYRCLKVNTSCEMVFGTRSAAVSEELGVLFPGGEPPRRRARSIRVWGRLGASFLAYLFGKCCGRRPRDAS